MRLGGMTAVTAAIAAIAASACVTAHPAVTPLDLAQQARPLVQEGRAEVTGTRGTLQVSADEVVNVRIREGDLERPTQLSVRDLVRGCVDDVTSPGCLAAHAVDEPALERPRIQLDRARAETAISFGLMAGAIGTCMVACRGGLDVEKGVEVAGGVVLGVAALFLLVAALGR
jgi:hypothetical protein